MYKSRKTMTQALRETRAYRDPIDEGITGNIQKAITIAKKMGGNMTGAIKEIEKIARGLSDDPSVRAALKTANESLDEDKEILQYLIKSLQKRVLTADAEKKKDLLKKIQNLKKQMSEDAPANEELDEAKDLMLTYGKPGGDAKVYYTDFMQDLQNKASEFRKKGFVIGKMGKTMPMSQLPKTMPMKGMDIKEEGLEEAMKLKYDKDKEGFYDEKGRRRYLSIGATNAIMRKKLDHAMKTGDWTDFNKEEVSLDERSPTKRELDSSELINLYQIKNKDAKILDRIAELQKKLGMKNEELETGEQNDKTV